MEILAIEDGGFAEACPRTSVDGFYGPNDNQQRTLMSRSEQIRLHPSLTDGTLVVWGDAMATLAAASVVQLLVDGLASSAAPFNGADNPDLPMAMADLAVVGEVHFADFVQNVTVAVPEPDAPPGTLRLHSGTVARVLVSERMEAQATRLGVTLSVLPGSAAARPSIERVLDRAYRVAWALNGPANHRQVARPALGWIACDAMHDQPRRPVNVPITPYPQADALVEISTPGGPVSCRARYDLAGARDMVDAPLDLLSNPPPNVPPWLDPDADIFVFLHGHSSRAEEAGGLFDELKRQAAEQFYPRSIAILSFDFPSNGYSQYIDHDELAPFLTTTRYVPDHPEERRFGMLECYERFVVGLVEAVHADMVRAGHPGILHRIKAVIGGSMGGNLGLRLAENLSTFPLWLQHVVAWSPASVYQSFARYDSSIVPSPQEDVNPIAYEVINRPRQRCMDGEGDGSRADFLRIQLQGERLINDGTAEFEFLARALPFLAGPLFAAAGGLPLVGPILAGLAGAAPIGSIILEAEAGSIAVNQSEEWLREECRAGYDSGVALANMERELVERYSPIRRRTHWRIAYEQLAFSHQDVVSASGGVPCFARAVRPLLLIAGTDDTVDSFTGFDIYRGTRTIAPQMRQNDGRAIFMAATGHSIHAERPKLLCREIIRFLMDRPLREVAAISRDPAGNATRVHFPSIKRSIDADLVINRSLSPVGGGYFQSVGEPPAPRYIYARQFLSAVPDGNPDNDLRDLPRTGLPVLRGRAARNPAVLGPSTGFEVTHIRIGRSGTGRGSSWVSHLCNDAQRLQIPTALAERNVYLNRAQYFYMADGVLMPLRLYRHMLFERMETVDNNLPGMPVIGEGDFI